MRGGSKQKTSSCSWGSEKQSWFQTLYIFNPTLGEDSNFDKHRFQMGQSTNQPPTRKHAAGMNRKMILYVKTQFAISPRLVRPGGDGVGPGDWKKHTTREEVQVFDEKKRFRKILSFFTPFRGYDIYLFGKYLGPRFRNTTCMFRERLIELKHLLITTRCWTRLANCDFLSNLPLLWLNFQMSAQGILRGSGYLVSG